MTNLVKRSLALLLALFLCLSLLPANLVSVDAASVNYVYDGKYIYNWGTRGTTATFLSQNAEAFYTGNNTYDALSVLAGGTGVSNAPSSSLYRALQNLMAGAHSYKTSYDATRDLYKYTDCQNSGGRISSFYSGKEIGPSWDSGKTWNREHTWPNSKGDASGQGENDIMMLRPASVSENSSRGNKAYGESSSFYNPNGESGGSLDLRGDVSRIMLYVYVRWGNTGSMWGSSGVIESLDVLLRWIAADPVDTWELGRNDSVQSITGTRNVFVDYPEFAFLLFGEDVPNNMSTPSGEAAGAVNCQHNYVAGTVVPATCTTDGYTVYTCSLCSRSYNGDLVAASHKFVDGVCTVCGETTYYVAETLVPGTAYKLGLHSTNKNATYYFKGTMSGYYGATDTAPESGVSVFVEETNGGYHLYFLDANGAKQYINLVASGTYRNFTFATTASSVYTWDAEKTALYTTIDTEVCYIGTYGTYVTMGVLQNSKLKDTDYIARLYAVGGSSNPDAPVCQHTSTKVEGAKAATCTEAGHTGKTVCNDCGVMLNAGSVINATGHSYVGGVCGVCGAQKPAQGETTTVTISFANTAQRTEFSTSKQVWKQNGITVTNEKAASTSNVADYSNPARFYKSSSLKIEYPGMTQIEFACSGSDYATALQSSITGATAVASGTKVTVTFDEPQDSLEIAKLSAQIRVKDIVITAAGAGETPDVPDCQHTNTTLEGAKEATCTVNGHTGKTVCVDCGATVNAGSVITATGHNFVNGTCSACGEKESAAPVVTTATISFASTAQRTEFNTSKQVWAQNGITVTNLKAASVNAVADYANPARFYAASSLEITYPGMTQIKFACNTAAYATDLKNSISGATVTVDGKIVTVTFDAAQDSFVIAKLTKQVRMDSITVTAAPAEPTCEHTNTTVEGKVDATCTTGGHTGKTVCVDCGEILSEGSAISAAGHNFVNGTCTKCGEAESEEPETPAEPTYVTSITAGTAYKLGLFSTSKNATYYFMGTMSGYYGATETVYEDGVDVFVEETDGGYYLYFLNASGAKQYINLVASGTYRNFTYATTASSVYTWNAEKNALYTTVEGEICYIGTYGSYVTMGVLQTAKLKDTDYIARLYTIGGSSEPDVPTCEHKNFTVEGAKAATCTTDGHTGKMICTDCGEVIDEGKVVTAPGHKAGAAATCTTAQTCIHCDYVCVEALGHTAGAEATCTTDQTCVRCDYVYAKAQGHTAGAAATCTTAQTCVRCDYVYAEALGHTAGAEATCTTAQTCIRCDYVYAEALNHTAGAEATCTTDQTCVRCDYIFVKALGHTAGADATCEGAQKCIRCDYVFAEGLGHTAGAAATCTTAQTCIRCDYVFVEALGHTAGAEATCTTAQTCIRCDYVYVKALGHTAGAEATCTTAQTCTVCGDVLVKALGHNPGADATCETAQTCTVCNVVLVEALGHTAGAAATCTTDQTCVRCDYVYVKALGHIAGAEATCTTAQTCTVCGDELVKALGHTGGAAATCTTAQICTVCNAEVVKALGHEAGAKATCTTAQTCVRCDYEYEAALGHDMHKYAGKAPTCTQVGWNEYESCSRCSRTTYTGIPAKGHSYKSTVTEPTCTEEGYTTNVCSVCNDVSKTNIVAVLDHKLNHVEGKEATVEAEGNIEYWTCQDCKGMWTDEACTKTTTEEAVVLAKLEVPATEATTVPATEPVPETTVGATNEKDEGTKTPTLLWGGLIVLIVLAAVIVLGIKKFGKK